MTRESYIETINQATKYDFDDFGEFLKQIELEDLDPLNIEVNYLIYRVAWISEFKGFKAGIYFVDRALKGE